MGCLEATWIMIRDIITMVSVVFQIVFILLIVSYASRYSLEAKTQSDLIKNIGLEVLSSKLEINTLVEKVSSLEDIVFVHGIYKEIGNVKRREAK